jgi:hypothetical protein
MGEGDDRRGLLDDQPREQRVLDCAEEHLASSPTSWPARRSSNAWPSTAPPRNNACPSVERSATRNSMVSRIPARIDSVALVGSEASWRRCSVRTRPTPRSGTPLGELGAAESTELEPSNSAAPAKFGQRCLRRRRHIGRPNRADDDHVRERRVRRQEGQQGQGARISPVEIVEDQQRRTEQPSNVLTASKRQRYDALTGRSPPRGTRYRSATTLAGPHDFRPRCCD